ncbi:helix-turn-helix domain-containing protein [Aquibacillus saliphilus]|uniref:helix-turn-helix domain-containing protein n=1 Tax=Aquibacillus saliphilus TaxID=1909422 RepID=UPI001CF0B080|nr:helix-turn-helix transcriptional regulator [Aquibacillus saliphilus]
MDTNVEFNRLFGKYIKYIRQEHGITQLILAERASVSTNSIGEIERGETEPKNYTIFKLEQALNMNVHEIYKKIKIEIDQQHPE